MYIATKKALLIEDCFRNIADYDYIAARITFRTYLMEQFLWAALQAIEKYLKAILLYFDVDTRTIRHDLEKAIAKVELIDGINWDFTDDHKEFISYLTRYGNDRYFMLSKGMDGRELWRLDDCVWNIRKFCFDIPYFKENNNNFEKRLEYITSDECKIKPNQYRLTPPGVLERILDQKYYVIQRRALVWKNFKYGKYKKHKIKFNRKPYGKRPVLEIFYNMYPWVKNHIYLPKNFQQEFEAEMVKLEKIRNSRAKGDGEA
ncbi:HEPN domain-containing protein [bacterium]|nr:HEPN domain-containing protein [bacterium]